jgi:hypothetical protein
MSKTISNYMQLMEMFSDLESESTLYISYNDDILDFTDKSKQDAYRLVISSKKGIYEIPMSNPWMMNLFNRAASKTIFSGNKKILTWNWKNFVSFCFGRFKIKFEFFCSIIDLKIIESFFGLRQKKPENFSECLRRLKFVLDSGKWPQLQSIYKSVYLPLMLDVIPALECVGILDQDRLHAYYEINGQENGRLLCFNAYTKGYVPHVITPDQKLEFKPLDFDQVFLYFDFKSMEVKVLQWLSKDPELQKVCESSDVYSSVYELITKTSCDSEDKRNLCKRFFLPIFYGMGVNAISENLGLPVKAAESIVERVKSTFSVAYSWIESFQNKAKEEHAVCDIFGKKRIFLEKEYKARNFVVQSPAAIFCLEKLIQLYKSLNGKAKIAYNVHDGYMLYSTRDNLKDVILESQSVLLSKSHLFPDMNLNISCYAGRKLSELKKININKRE